MRRPSSTAPAWPSPAPAGARAVNKIQTGITARISDQNQQNRFEAGSVTVRALDQAEINSTIAAVAIAVAVSLGATAALSVAASLAQNEIGNTTLATMDGVRIAGAPAITVKADSQAAITTVSVAVSVSVGAGLGGVSLAGGGANARNLIGSSATALVNGSRIDGNAGNALNIDADMSGTIKATVVVASVGFTAAGASLAIGSALAENSITETAGARAGLTGSKLSNLGAVSVTADSAAAGSQGRGRRGGGGHGRRGAGRAGAAAFNTSKAVTRAYVDGLTQVDTAVRAAESLTVKATNTSTLEATAVGASAAGTGSGLALSVGAAVAGNKTLGAVEAYVDNSVLSVSGTGAQMARLSVAAQDGSTLKAKAVGASLAFSMQGGSVAVGATDVKNVAAASVQARVSGATITVSDGVSVTAKKRPRWTVSPWRPRRRSR